MARVLFLQFLLLSLLKIIAMDVLWPNPIGNIHGERFSVLKDINLTNIQLLKPTWELLLTTPTYPDRHVKATPLVIDDGGNKNNSIMIFCDQFNDVIALNPYNGDLVWKTSEYMCKPKGEGGPSCRGVTSWINPNKTDGEICRRTIFMATMCLQLVALDAATGNPCLEFGDNGTVNMPEIPIEESFLSLVGVSAPPIVVNGIVASGSMMEDFKFVNMPKSAVWAFEAATGKRLWSFYPIPINSTNNTEWVNGTDNVGAANVWSTMTADEELNLIFMGTSSPSPDLYGGFRWGPGRFADSIVAVNASTGNIVWSFQTIHHDLWDYDIGAHPMITTMNQKKVLVIATKLAYIFMFDALTGTPISEIMEVPVPASDAFGELAYPTQPIPKNPSLRLGRYIINEETIWGPNNTEKNNCLEFLNKLHGRQKGLTFTPPSINGSLWNPGSRGGFNWQSCALNPNNNTLYCMVLDQPLAVQLINTTTLPDWCSLYYSQKGAPYGFCYTAFQSNHSFPCLPPPWSRLVKIDLENQIILWDVPLGYRPVEGFKKEWGSPNHNGGILLTEDLVFVTGTEDKNLYAFDTYNGNMVFKSQLSAISYAPPMTYKVMDKQFISFVDGQIYDEYKIVAYTV